MTSFEERIEHLAKRSKDAERQAHTEEATKTAVILPFLQALGFDVFNLSEVVPEFVADVGTKKGEKVDFSVKIDGQIVMLVEAKPIGTKLSNVQFNQLFRYFTVTDAKLAVLTNGREAWFFSDTEEPNKMDKKPFFKFDFQKHDSSQIQELSRFQKEKFDIHSIIEAASNLKYARDAANYLKKQITDPDEEFVRHVGRQIHDGTLTKSVVEQIKPALQAAFDTIMRERIQEKLSITLQDPQASATSQQEKSEGESDGEIITTDEEHEGFKIVRAIAARLTRVDRITMRDAKSYCAVLMDDNNRKPICRLYFNSPTTKNIGIFDQTKSETKHRISSTSDIYAHVQEIENVIKSYID